jgi:hypothetical protein
MVLAPYFWYIVILFPVKRLMNEITLFTPMILNELLPPNTNVKKATIVNRLKGLEVEGTCLSVTPKHPNSQEISLHSNTCTKLEPQLRTTREEIELITNVPTLVLPSSFANLGTLATFTITSPPSCTSSSQ